MAGVNVITNVIIIITRILPNMSRTLYKSRLVCLVNFTCRQFTKDSLEELEKFNYQKAGDFRSMLINYVQLQMHIHKKVSIMQIPSTPLSITLYCAGHHIMAKDSERVYYELIIVVINRCIILLYETINILCHS